MEVLLSLSFFISFLLTFFTMPFWIYKAKKAGLVWEDMNKYKHPKNVAGSGGIVVVLAFVIGVLYYVSVRTFVIKNVNGVSLSIFALLSVILILSIVGIIDDLLGWHNKGLSKRTRIILAFIASIPLVVINAGSSSISIPYFGLVELGPNLAAEPVDVQWPRRENRCCGFQAGFADCRNISAHRSGERFGCHSVSGPAYSYRPVPLSPGMP